MKRKAIFKKLIVKNKKIMELLKSSKNVMKINYLTPEELKRSLSIVDLTDSANGVHSINLILDKIKFSIIENFLLCPTVVRNSPIVKSIDNYDNLYYPKLDITKSSIYTRWVNESEMLRTQTTSGITKILKKHTENDSIYMLPGIVYRRDVIDKNHVAEPHQLDIWRVSNLKRYNRTDLLELVQTIIDSIFPGVEWRYNETSHYYTKDGIEVEVLINGNWLEILECGEILPKLLDDNGLDSNIWSGLALGIGLDRAVMIKKQITDIRLLRHTDSRIANQMQNLDLYNVVSSYPAINRDISIAILKNIDNELLGDQIRNLVENSEIIEEIIIKSETPYESLPSHVSERLGMNDTMKNVLIRIKLRALDKTLTNLDANELINQLYGKVHIGAKGYINI